jgi:hypothetical protein
MKTDFIQKNSLYIMTAIAAVVLIFTIVQWNDRTFLQRIDGLILVALVLHLWEEGKLPGGFTRMIAEKIHFTQADPYFGDMVTGLFALLIALVPMFFPNLMFMALAPVFLGFFELCAHLAAIRISPYKFYSPGMCTAVCVLFPISLLATIHIISHRLVPGITWLWAFLYMLCCLLCAQQIVVRTSGMKYSEFLKNAKNALFGRGR